MCAHQSFVLDNQKLLWALKYFTMRMFSSRDLNNNEMFGVYQGGQKEAGGKLLLIFLRVTTLTWTVFPWCSIIQLLGK